MPSSTSNSETGRETGTGNQYWIATAIFLGLGLRLVQYFANASLFVDEAMLAASIVHKPIQDLLTGPLDYGQAAPAMFLVASKASAFLFGYGELALRLPALLSSIAVLLCFVLLARRTLQGAAVPFAVFLVATSPWLVRYAAQLKQYSFDVLAAIVMMLLAIRVMRSDYSRREVLRASVAGVVVVWWSQASVLVMTGLGIAFVLQRHLCARSETAVGRLATLALAWLSGAVASLAWVRYTMTPASRQVMLDFWTAAGGFMPFPPRSLSEIIWAPRMLRGVYWDAFNLHWVTTAAFLLALWGLVSFWRKGRADASLVVAAPVLVTLFASAATAYPFSGRLILFILPALAIAMAEGVHSAAGALARKRIIPGAAVFAIFVISVVATTAAALPPWLDEELKPALAHLTAARRESDAIWVFYDAYAAMAYYAPRYGLGDSDWTRGVRSDQLSGYRSQVDQFAGEGRLWLVFSRDVMRDAREAITGHLDSTALRLDSASYPVRPFAFRAYVYLYDLSPRAKRR